MKSESHRQATCAGPELHFKVPDQLIHSHKTVLCESRHDDSMVTSRSWKSGNSSVDRLGEQEEDTLETNEWGVGC